MNNNNNGPIKPHPVKAQPVPLYKFSTGSVDTLVNNYAKSNEYPW